MKAILAGLLLLAAAAPTRAADFSYHLMLTDDSKLNRYFDFENSVDDFMQCFRRPLWERVRSDEFELQGKRAETLTIMKTEAASADLGEPVRIVTTVDFGDYDFARQRFALHPFTDATFFTATAPCSVSALPATIRVFFSNPGILDGLPMPAGKAKAFLDGRKSQVGSVDRRLEATVTFRVGRMKADGELVGEILKVVLTDTGPQKLGVVYPAGE
jgi:hypothetical protein